MSRLVSINGTLIDLEYIYKIDIVLPDINSYNRFIKDSHFVCNRELGLSQLHCFLPKQYKEKRAPSLIFSVYSVYIYIFNIDKPETFYFAHEELDKSIKELYLQFCLKL